MNAHQTELNFSRRDLLKGGGALLSASAWPACRPALRSPRAATSRPRST